MVSRGINFVLEVAIRPNKVEDLKRLAEVMIAETAQDPGVIYYHWSYDNGILRTVEHYESNEATLNHLKWFGENYAKQFGELGTVKSCHVYGDPSYAVRAALDSLGSVYMTTLGSYQRER